MMGLAEGPTHRPMADVRGQGDRGQPNPGGRAHSSTPARARGGSSGRLAMPPALLLLTAMVLLMLGLVARAEGAVDPAETEGPSLVLGTWLASSK